MEENDDVLDTPWFVTKEPINGKMAIFTEDIYRQFMGSEPTVAERVQRLLDDLGYPPAPVHVDTHRVHGSGDVGIQHENSNSSASRENSKDGSTEQDHLGTSSDPQQLSDRLPSTKPIEICPESFKMPNFAGRGDGQSKPHFSGKRGGQVGAYQAGFGQNRGRGRGAGRGKNFRSMPDVRKSSLTHEQHMKYLELFKKCTQRFFGGFCQPPNERELKEIMEFEKLQMLVAKEQEEFQVHLKNVALSDTYLYTSLQHQVQKYTTDKQESCCKRAQSYTRHYNNHSQLPMAVRTIDPTTAALVLVNTLLEVGSKCKVVVPEQKQNGKQYLRPDYNAVIARFPPQESTSQDSTFWNHEPVSRDSNMETLVTKHRCQVVTTAGVLSLLLSNNPPFCDIPITVRHYENSASGKVVFLDKPLFPQGLSPAEKKTKYLQKQLRTFMCHLPHQSKMTSQAQGGTCTSPKSSTTSPLGPSADANILQKIVRSSLGSVAEDNDDDPFGAAFSMDDLETFGSDKHSSFSLKKVQGLQTEGAKDLGIEEKGLSASMSQAPPKMADCISNVHSSVPVKAEVDSQKMSYEHPMDDDSTEVEMASFSHGSGNVIGVCTNAQSKGISATMDTSTTMTLSSEQNPTTLPHKRHLRSTFKSDEDDSDEDALCIVTQDDYASQKATDTSGLSSPASSLTSVTCAARESNMVTGDLCDGNEPSGRRFTRSTSQRLKSADVEPGVNKERISSAAQNMDINPEVSKLQTLNVNTNDGGDIPSSAKKSKREEEIICEKRQESPGGVTEKSLRSKELQSSSTKKKQSASCQGAVGSGRSAKSTPLDSILQLQKEMLPGKHSTRQKMRENAEDYREPLRPGESVSYSLWDLAGLSLLLRCGNHGFVRGFRQESKPVYLVAKPERQLPSGLEQTTLSESVRSWIGCYLRPNSYLLRVRVDMRTDEIAHTEELQLNQILQPTLSFSVPSAFAMLKNIFSKLTDLPVGNYLLSHEPGTDHFQLRVATENKRSGYDLHFQHMGFSMMGQTEDETVPWIPVDPTLILPHHWRLGLIPATFQPPDFDVNRKKQMQVAPKRHYYKKKQRGKKKNN